MTFSFGPTTPAGRTVPSPKRFCKPTLEALETRTLLTTFVVTNTSGDPNTTGSLPFAVNQVNQDSSATPANPDLIQFNIGGGGDQVIGITNVMVVARPVNIDGTSQPGYNGAPLISIRGDANVPAIFSLTASNTTLQGLDMAQFSNNGNGVTINTSSQSDTIKNNWIGFFLDGGGVHLNAPTNGSGSGQSGIAIQSSNNQISGNTIDGTYTGIRIGEDPYFNSPSGNNWSGTVYQGNIVQNNRLGTDPTGSSGNGWGNQANGISLLAGAQNNFVGPNNVISGNGVHGVEILAPSAKGDVVFGNFIGTDATGSFAIPNLGQGILIANRSNGNTIGGSFGGNIISGNSQGGVELGASGFGGAFGNFVQNNNIGLNAAKTTAIPNGSFGVALETGSQDNLVQNNTIKGNNGVAILVASDSTNNTIAPNDTSGGTPTIGNQPTTFADIFQPLEQELATLMDALKQEMAAVTQAMKLNIASAFAGTNLDQFIPYAYVDALTSEQLQMVDSYLTNIEDTLLSVLHNAGLYWDTAIEPGISDISAFLANPLTAGNLRLGPTGNGFGFGTGFGIG